MWLVTWTPHIETALDPALAAKTHKKVAVSLDACPSIIVVHNHPSGDPTPSPEDVLVTRTLRTSAAMMDIELLDHIVLGQGQFVSLKDKGLGF